jgi:WD40 repeat protein/serine/threonine protein kinase
MAAIEDDARSIFLSALGRAPDQWPAYLDEACGGDAEVRARVNQLLRAHRAMGNIPGASPPGATVDEVTAAEGPGAPFGPYKLLEEIGEGGFAVVYLAEQTQPVRRKVAVKVLKPGMATRQVVARFEAERQALAIMDHPNIAKVFDAGATPTGRPFFVMELVRGTPITEFCDANQLPPRQRLELFATVCQAVQHAHQKGIIHRDIKPTNVLVSRHDTTPVVKVIDFGVAKALGQELTEKTLFTGIAQMIGTPLYMSPEQAGMSDLDIDTRTDVYSLGVLLYELLTGTTPFTQERFKKAGYDEIRRIIHEEEPPRPSTRLADSKDTLASISARRHTEPARLTRLVRGELDWITMKCLEKDRNRRYATANELAADLQRYLADQPVQACPPSAPYRLRKFARRNKVALVTATLISAALVTAVAVLAISNVRITQETNQKENALQQAWASETEANLQKSIAQENAATAKTQRGIAVENEKTAKANEVLARRRLYAAQMNLAQLASEQGQPARVLELLEGQRPKFDQEDLRRFEWYYLWGLGHRGYRKTLRAGPGGVLFLAYSPDGKTLASGSGDGAGISVGTVRLWHAVTGERTLPCSSSTIWAVAFSPDGKTLAAADRDKVVRLWDVDTGQERATFTGHTDAVRCVAFSPDGKTLASGSADSCVKLWDLATGQARTYDQGDGVVSLAFSPDGKTLASADLGQGKVKLWACDGATLRERARLKADGGPAIAFSPDGTTLATACLQLKLWDVATGAERVSLDGRTGIIHAVAFSPDGKTLASGGNDRTIKLWDLATRQARTLRAHRSPILSITYSPDGTTLASGGEDGTVTLWDGSASPPPDVLTHKGAVNYLSFSPTGDALFAGGLFPTTIWDPATGGQRATLPMQSSDPFLIPWATTLMAVSPDGKTLAYVQDNTIRFWDAAAKRERGKVQCLANFVSALAFSPDGKTFASASSWPITIQLWDVAKLRPKISFQSFRSVVSSMAFSPDGTTLATGIQFGRVVLWDPATGTEKAILQGYEGAWSRATVAFSRDGKTLATANNRGLVRLWDVATARQFASLKGHTDDVRSLAFFPDGETLATGSDDGTVKLWDVATGQEKVTLPGHLPGFVAIAISPNGNILASGSGDGIVRLWRASTHADALARQTEDDRSDPDSPRAQKEAGDRLWTNGQNQGGEQAYRQAIAQLEKRLATSPNSSDDRRALAVAYDALGSLLAAAGRLPEAEQARRQTRLVIEPLAADPSAMVLYITDLFRSQLGLGRLLEAAGRHPEAEAAFSRAIELSPQAPEAWFGRAYVHTKAGQYDKALADYSKVVELKPDDAAAWNNLGHCDLELGDPGKAMEHFSKAIALDPTDALHWLNRGRVHAMLGKREEAWADINKAIELKPNDPEYLFQRAQLRLQQGEWDLAADEFSAVIKRMAGAPGAWLAYRGRAVAYSQSGWFAAAQADYEKALELLKLAPQSAEARNNLAWFLATCPDASFRDPARAVELANKAVELAPKEGTFWNTLGVAQFRAGDFKAAVDALNKSMELRNGGDADDWFFLAMARWQQGDKIEGQKWYDKAVAWMEKNNPKDEELAFFRAEATDSLVKALEPPDGNSRHRIDLGNTLRNAGEFNAAVAQFSKVIAADPKLVEAWENRSDCYLRLGGAHAKSGRWGEAETAYRNAAAGYEKLITDFPPMTAQGSARGTTWWRHELGFACIAQADDLQHLGQLPEAEAVLCRGIEVHEMLVADYPAAANYKRRLAWNLHRLGNVRKARGQRPAAERAYRDAMALLEKAGLNDHSLAESYESLADLKKEDGRIPEAIEAEQKAVAAWKELAAATNDRDRRRHLGYACEFLGGLLKQANRSEEAEVAFRESLPVWEGLLRQQPDSKDYRSHLHGTYRAVIDLPLSRSRQAGDWKAALAALEKSIESGKAGDANDWFFQAMARWQLGNKSDARKWYGRAVDWMETNDPRSEELGRFRAEAEKLLELKQ